MPLPDYFSKDIGTDWCKPADSPSTYKVYNNAVVFLILFFCNVGAAVGAAVGSGNYGLLGILGTAFGTLALALSSITSVRREGDLLILSKWAGGALKIPLTNIDSIKVGYKSSCCDCKDCGVAGEFGKDESSNILIICKTQISCGSNQIGISIMDGKTQDFIDCLVNKKTEA